MHESQHHACATRTRVPAQSPHVGDQLLRVTMTFVDASSIRELLRSSARLCVLTAASIPNAQRVECARNRNLCMQLAGAEVLTMSSCKCKPSGPA